MLVRWYGLTPWKSDDLLISMSFRQTYCGCAIASAMVRGDVLAILEMIERERENEDRLRLCVAAEEGNQRRRVERYTQVWSSQARNVLLSLFRRIVTFSQYQQENAAYCWFHEPESSIVVAAFQIYHNR
jgi:hypothetical protein